MIFFPALQKNKGLYRYLLFFIVFFLSSCSQLKPKITTQNLVVTNLQTVHTLDVYAEDNSIHVLLSGVDTESEQTIILRYINSLDAGETWSSPVTINQDITPVKKSKRGNDFQVAAFGDKIMAIWQTDGDEPWVGILSAALSSDQGKTWRKISSPVDNKYSKISQGYADLVADGQGTFHATWLDDREEAGNTQGLRYASFQNEEAGWIYQHDLELTSCTCCWSNIITDINDNVHVLFRNDSPRDMMLISSFSHGKSWGEPSAVWPFGWDFVGCPHQGGGITTTHNKGKTSVHSVVWNGKESNLGLYYHQLKSTEKNELPPVSLGDETSASADIAAIGKDSIGVVYTTDTIEGKKVMAKLSKDGGQSWLEEQRLTNEGAEPSHPKIVATKKGFRFFWTEWQDDGSAIVVMSEMEN